MRNGYLDASDFSAAAAERMRAYNGHAARVKDAVATTATGAFAEHAFEHAMQNFPHLLPIPAGERVSPAQVQAIKDGWTAVLQNVLAQ